MHVECITIELVEYHRTIDNIKILYWYFVDISYSVRLSKLWYFKSRFIFVYQIWSHCVKVHFHYSYIVLAKLMVRN